MIAKVSRKKGCVREVIGLDLMYEIVGKRRGVEREEKHEESGEISKEGDDGE